MGREHLSWLTAQGPHATYIQRRSLQHLQQPLPQHYCHLPAFLPLPGILFMQLSSLYFKILLWCQFALRSKKYLLWARTPSNLCSKHQLDSQSTTEDPTCCLEVAVPSVVASVVMILLSVVTMMSHQPLVPAASTGSLAPLFVRTAHVISPANGGPAPGQPTNHSAAAVASCKNVQSCVACSTAAPQLAGSVQICAELCRT